MQTTMTIVAPAGQQAQNQSLVELGMSLILYTFVEKGFYILKKYIV